MQMSSIDSFPQASLAEILQAREQRQLRQHNMLQKHKTPLISLSLNIAGANKQFPLARKTYEEAKKMITRHLERTGALIIAKEEVHAITGSEGCFAISGQEASLLKKNMIAIEESTPLARLFDIDVLDRNARHLSRKDFGLASRRCLLCDGPAACCARSKAHALEDVRRRTMQLMTHYFAEQKAHTLAAYALRSLMYEVCITPKPGLVDRISNGAHTDMDIFTFMNSISVLFPYFRQCAMLGLEEKPLEPQELFARLRYPGQEAEDAMYLATGQVNTHKGAIFSLGIICAAAGRLLRQQEILNAQTISATCAAMTATVLDECQNIPPNTKMTNGLKLYKTGIGGARGEAASGFASVLRYGLPCLEDQLAAGASIDQAGTMTLLQLMANVFDTNIISRSSIQAQDHIHSLLQSLLAENAVLSAQRLQELDTCLVANNISPGGCADLLGISWMLYFLQQDTTLAEE